MNSQHTHQWFRAPSISEKGKNYFYCRYPTCYKKIKLEALHNKMAECPICSQRFLVDFSTVPFECSQLVCPKCSGIPAATSQAQILETIKNEAELFLSTNYVKIKEELKVKENYLTERELLLEARLTRLQEQKTFLALRIREFRTRMRTERLRLHELKQKLDAKIRTQKEAEQSIYSPTTDEQLDKQILADAILNILQGKIKPDESNGPS